MRFFPIAGNHARAPQAARLSPSRKHAQRRHARKVAVVRDERCGVDRKRAPGLNRVSQFQPQRRSKPRRVFGDIHIEGDRPPRFEDGAAPPRERLVARAKRPGRRLGDRDGRDGEAKPALRMRLEERPEPRREFWDDPPERR